MEERKKMLPNPQNLEAGNRIQDPNGVIWVVQGNDKSQKKIGLTHSMQNQHKIIKYTELMSGWALMPGRGRVVAARPCKNCP